MKTTKSMHDQRPLRRGDLVFVKSFEEIVSTLDETGCREGLPFMPEMIPFCGQSYEVQSRLDRICVEAPRFGFRSMSNVVVLKGLECSGINHDSCQRSCMLLWKEDWLRSSGDGEEEKNDKAIINVDSLQTRRDDGRYICQSSELVNASFDGKFTISETWASEYLKGNVSHDRVIPLMAFPAYLKVRARLTGIPPWQIRGVLQKTPGGSLGLQPGDWVEVKSLEEIRSTLSQKGRNRGLTFTRLQSPYCGQRFRVKTRVENMILEGSGEMRTLKDTVLLEGVTCDGYIFPGGCSRGVYHFWREIWLRKLDDPAQP